MKILKFYIPSSEESQVLGGMLKKIGVTTEDINVVEHEEEMEKYGVHVIPTLLFIEDDKEIDRVEFPVPFTELVCVIEAHKKSNGEE